MVVMKTAHDIIWEVVEEIAEQRGVSLSRLAVTAGLDATAFNPSKRLANGGLPRFPAMTTMLAVLKVTGLTWYDFAKIWEMKANQKSKK